MPITGSCHRGANARLEIEGEIPEKLTTLHVFVLAPNAARRMRISSPTNSS